MKYLKYLLYTLLAISSAIILVFYGTGFSDGMVSLALNWSIVLMVICLLSAACLPLFFSTGKGAKSSMIKVGIVVVLCVVSYIFASGDPVKASVAVEPTASTLKLIDTGLVLTSFLFVIAVLAILSGGIISSIRNR
ncbi:MAG: hypothetical protein RSC28_06935 [Bacteroidales bacterium]